MNAIINTVIIDDRESAIKALVDELKTYPEVCILEATTSLEKAKKSIIKNRPNLLFLDVEMPGQTGLEFLEEISFLGYKEMCVVFYSAFDKYMIDALRASAFDYLLKPFQKKELDNIIKRIKEKILSGTVNFEQAKYHSINLDRRFAIHTVSGLQLLNQMEILYFEFINNQRYWQLRHTNLSHSRLLTNTTSKDILKMNPSFIQISKDYIININYISSIENKTYRCLLYPPFNNLEIYASRRYYSQIKNSLEIL